MLNRTSRLSLVRDTFSANVVSPAILDELESYPDISLILYETKSQSSTQVQFNWLPGQLATDKQNLK